MNPTPPNRTVPPDRKAIYYAGLALGAFGLLLFLSTFVTFALHFGDFKDFESNARSEILRAVVGMISMIAGGALSAVGARGFAGSGLMIDPERARRDMEPWARVAGGLTDDAFSEMTTVREAIGSVGRPGGPEVKVRCPNCQALSDEASRFCGQCGKPL